MKTQLKQILATTALSLVLPMAVHSAAHAAAHTAGAPAADMTSAEVRKVDKEQGKVTLKHGPIKNLDMPGMTMVFNVKEKAMLDGVKAGDKVNFKAADVAGKMTVTEMQPAK